MVRGIEQIGYEYHSQGYKHLYIYVKYTSCLWDRHGHWCTFSPRPFGPGRFNQTLVAISVVSLLIADEVAQTTQIDQNLFAEMCKPSDDVYYQSIKERIFESMG